MPEYLAPGVYVEEVSYRSKSIEGVSTTTTAFVGPTRTGPVDGEPELLTSFSEFERRYGGLDPLDFAGSDEPMHNYMGHAVRAFFANGGRRLYVARAFRSYVAQNAGLAAGGNPVVPVPEGVSADGVARAILPAPSASVGSALGGASAAVEQARDTLNRARAAVADVTRTEGAIVSAAVQALRTALDNLNQLLPAPDGAIAAIDAAATSAGDIDNTINGIIGGLPEPPQGDVQTDFNTNVRPAVQARDAAQALAAAATAVTTAADVQVGRLGTVENEGTTAGEGVEPIPGNAEATAEAAATGVTTASDAARTAGTAASTARGVANASAAALSTTAPAGINAAVAQAATDAGAALTAATTAVTAAQAALDAAVTAFRDGTVGQRAATAASFGLFRARFPGRAGNMVVRVLARRGPNIVRRDDGQAPTLQQTRPNDLVWVDGPTSGLFLAQRSPEGVWSFVGADGNAAAVDLATEATRVHVVIFSVEAEVPGAFAQTLLWTELTADGVRRESIQRTFAPDILNPIKEIETPLVLEITGAVHPVAIGGALLGENLATIGNATAPLVTTFRLTGGNDGFRPSAEEYTGRRNDDSQISSGLVSFEDIEEISIVAAPGLSFGALNGYANTAAQATQALLSHCETMRYRVAVLDSPENAAMSQVQDWRAQLDTTRAALYYPWVRIQDPVSQEPIHVPPSGFVAGIYARNDINRGVHKAPANEVVNGAIGLETLINKGQQDVLNPRGINCLRYFENRGNRVWGARTLSSDPEWKYLNIRRYFAFLERSIEKSTQWAVFEPNGEALWANVRRSVEDFLYNEWKSEHLAGSKPVEAFFVKCDRTTMSQNDLDNGRMICLIGVAPLYPAEFVIFRIGQWTADRPS